MTEEVGDEHRVGTCAQQLGGECMPEDVRAEPAGWFVAEADLLAEGGDDGPGGAVGQPSDVGGASAAEPVYHRAQRDSVPWGSRCSQEPSGLRAGESIEDELRTKAPLHPGRRDRRDGPVARATVMAIPRYSADR